MSNLNVGKPWTKEEDEQLYKLYQKDQLDVLEISKIHQRNPNGIIARLIRNKIIPNKSSARGSSNLYETKSSELLLSEPEIIKIKDEEYFLYNDKIYGINKVKGELYGFYDKETNTIISSKRTLDNIINWITNNLVNGLRIMWISSLSNEIIKDHFKENILFVKSSPNVIIHYNSLQINNWTSLIDESISTLSYNGNILILEKKQNIDIELVKGYMIARGFIVDIKESSKTVFIVATKIITKPRKVMFLDTETSGIPYSNDYTQLSKYDNARLIELGYIIYNGDIMELEYDSLVKPNNFIITNEFVHGITQDNAINNGKNLKEVLEKLYNDLQQVDAIICHNIKFDMNILLSECYRINYTDLIKLIESKNKICTMKLGKEYMNISKNPKLIDLYKFIFNEPVKQDHRSLSDCHICAKCYFKILEK